MKGLCSKAYDTARLCWTRCEERELRRKAKLELKDFFFFFKKEQNENDPERTTVPFKAISLGSSL